MRVTDLDYGLEDKLVKRLNAFAKMVSRTKQIQDVLFTVHGKTGMGKTNSALVCAYYLKSLLPGREINLFFSTEKAWEFAKLHKNCIIIIDEPSLDSLSKDQMTRVNKDFMRLLNTMRQKRHIVIVNITRFWRFPFDLVVDRSLAMIHMNNRNGKTPGRFLYIRQKNLEELWDIFHRTHKKMFGKLKSFGGIMPERMEKLDETGHPYFNRMGIIINGKKNCTYEDYKEFRDQEIGKIGDTGKSKKELAVEKRLIEDRYKFCIALEKISKRYNIPKHELKITSGFPIPTLYLWEKKGENHLKSLGETNFESSPEST